MTKNKHVLYFDNHYTAPVMVRGEGPYLYDEEGRRYLETCGGSISNSLAYGREEAPETLAAGLFDCLRVLDTPEVKLICARCPSEEGVGRAVVNRLKKAAGGKITCL